MYTYIHKEYLLIFTIYISAGRGWRAQHSTCQSRGKNGAGEGCTAVKNGYVIVQNLKILQKSLDSGLGQGLSDGVPKLKGSIPCGGQGAWDHISAPGLCRWASPNTETMVSCLVASPALQSQTIRSNMYLLNHRYNIHVQYISTILH